MGKVEVSQHQWAKFTEQNIRKALHGLDLTRTLIIILRTDGKTYSGHVDSLSDIGSAAVRVTNWLVQNIVLYDRGPPKKFTVIDLPEMEFRAPELRLPLA